MNVPRDRHAVPFLDLGPLLLELEPELQAGLARILESGQVLEGPEVESFEREWATFCGSRHAVGVGSGTEALRLILAALGIGGGDEVIVPALTAVPTAAAICATGAIPVPVDVDAQTAALDEEAARAAMSDRTKAVIVVHLYGRPAPIPDLGVPVIEDAAHAHGALSSVSGIAAAYSFYPTKNLGAIGDGGVVVTDDRELSLKVARLRVHGRDEDGLHREIATNSRLSEFAAMALRVQLPRLRAGNGRRREIAAAYRASAPALRWHAEHPDHAHHLCVVRVPDRAEFRSSLSCGTGVHYPRAIVDEPAYARFERDPVPAARGWAGECVSMPCHPQLSDEDVEAVCASLASWSRG